MKKNEVFVLMGDIVSSSNYDQKRLSQNFTRLLEEANQKFTSNKKTKFTQRIGDEFQVFLPDLETTLKAIFFINEQCLKNEPYFSFRFVISKGIPNGTYDSLATGVMGEFLTEAYSKLNSKDKNRKQVSFLLKRGYLDSILENLFVTMRSITTRWPKKDYQFIFDILHFENLEELAIIEEKNKQQIKKRTKTLQIEGYKKIKEAILLIAKEFYN